MATKKTKTKKTATIPVMFPTGGINTKAPVSIRFELFNADAKQVCLVGSFNQWTPEKSQLASDGRGRWTGNLPLPPGKHEYLFVVDGDWMPDPNASETVQNPFGGRNSVVSVKAAA